MNNVIPIAQQDYRQHLSVEEIDAIEAECQQYESRAAAAIDAMLIVQSHRRWIDDTRLNAIADLLGMSSAQLEGVATFYNHIYRQPVGKHVIHVCNSISCWLADYQQIQQFLQQELQIQLGETTEDGEITLLPNVCLGCCDKAPAFMLDGELIDELDIAKVQQVLQQLRGVKNA